MLEDWKLVALVVNLREPIDEHQRLRRGQIYIQIASHGESSNTLIILRNWLGATIWIGLVALMLYYLFRSLILIKQNLYDWFEHLEAQAINDEAAAKAGVTPAPVQATQPPAP
jgi:hypothetical protein